MVMEEQDYSLENTRKRTEDLHSKIGALSSRFAGLELQLIETLSKCINPTEPNRAVTALSMLTFRQCTNALHQTLLTLFDKQEIVEQIKSLFKRLDEIALKRNDIIHSTWIAYSTDDYGQHRARAKGKKSEKLPNLKENPEQKVIDLVDEIDKLLFELICFEDELIKSGSEQGHAP
jgi:uncharacterized coiled-coil DUF342 family protein